MMTIKEIARAIDYLRTVGLSERQICDFLVYIAADSEMDVDEED